MVNKNQTIGEYLAPEVKVVEMRARQHMLSGSPTNVSNPFGGEEEDW